MRCRAEKWRADEWPDGVRAWFQRKVMGSLSAFRDYEGNPWEFRQLLADPEVVAWVTRWYCDRLETFCSNADPDTIWVSDWEGDDQRIQYDKKSVADKAQGVVRRAKNALAGGRESKAYANAETWLEALLAGEIEWSGPSEPSGYTMVADATSFITAKKMRQRTWPRLCRGCSTEFRPEKANTKNCPDGRAKRRAARG